MHRRAKKVVKVDPTGVDHQGDHLTRPLRGRTLGDPVTNLIAFVQSLLASLRSEEEGATMVEYGLVVAAIAIIALVGAQLVGTNLLGAFNGIAGDLL